MKRNIALYPYAFHSFSCSCSKLITSTKDQLGSTIHTNPRYCQTLGSPPLKKRRFSTFSYIHNQKKRKISYFCSIQELACSHKTRCNKLPSVHCNLSTIRSLPMLISWPSTLPLTPSPTSIVKSTTSPFGSAPCNLA